MKRISFLIGFVLSVSLSNASVSCPNISYSHLPPICFHTSSGVAHLMGTSIELVCTASAPTCNVAIALSTNCLANAKRRFSTLIFLTDF